MKKIASFITAGALVTGAIIVTQSVVASGSSQRSRSVSGPELGLVGVRLYDSSLKVISLYGNPIEIQPINTGDGGAAAGPAGPGAGAGGRGGGGNGAAGAATAQPGPGAMSTGNPTGFFGLFEPDDYATIPEDLRQQGAAIAPPGMRGKGGGAQSGPPGGPGGPGPGGPPRGGGSSPDGGQGGTSTASETATYTRWIYKKNATKMGFIIDKFNRVVQIEAIGLENKNVKTRRGIGFGSTFSSVMKAYSPSHEPDGYDLAGDTMTIRFLTKHRVAFRLSKLAAGKPHQVTGVVVAAGK